MSFLTTKNANIYYEVEGAGYPLVFIHGMGLSHLNWRKQVDFFIKRGYKTITLDTRGHGRSSETYPAGRHENVLHQISSDVASTLKKLDINKAVFIGYSTGTVTVQDIALSYPSMVDGLVLTGAFPKITNLYLFGKFSAGLGLTYINAKKVLAQGVAKSNGKDERQINMFRQEAYKVKRNEAIRILKACLRFDCRKDLVKIKAPILVTYGGNETHMMTYRRDYLTYAPTAEVVMFPHVNHAVPTKSTDSYNEVLLDFIEKIRHSSDSNHHFLNPNNINPTPNPISNSLE